MHFRPRYSLLTLLLVTALVAGGVKLWRWPHHVVERPEWLSVSRYPEAALEYSFYYDWRGERVIDGPWFIRIDAHAAGVRYYRHGKGVAWHYRILSRPVDAPLEGLWGSYTEPGNPLTAEEQAECQQLLQRERRRMTKPGDDICVISESFYEPSEHR